MGAGLSEGWTKGTVLDFLELKRGYDLPVSKRQAGQYPIFASNGLLDFHNEFMVKGPGVVTGRSGTIGKVYFVEDDYWPLNTSLYVRNFKGNHPLYVSYFLNAFELDKYGSGTGVPTLNRNDVHKVTTVFPPLPEQKKIARILSAVDNKLALIDQQITATQTLKQGLMQKLFSEGVGTQDDSSDGKSQWQPHTEFKDSELGRIPVGWEITKLIKLIEKLESGVSVNGEDRQRTQNEIAVLKISSVSYGFFDPVQHKVIIEKDISRAKLNPKKDQILISRSNTESLVGASVYVDDDYPDLFLPDKLWQTVAYENAPLVMRWLAYLLGSEGMREALSGMATGTSGSMKNITKGEFLGLSVALPPVEEQQEIAKVLSVVDKKLEHLTTQKNQTQQLKKGLMQKLLTGQIRVKPEPQDH